MFTTNILVSSNSLLSSKQICKKKEATFRNTLDEEEAIAKYGAWIVKFTIIETHLRMSSTVNLLEQSSKGPCHSSQPPRPWTVT